MSSDNIVLENIEKIISRAHADGGFSMYEGKPVRPDATAWAVLALKASGNYNKRMLKACRRLAKFQHPDGRVTLIESHYQSHWPTSLAILAWQKEYDFQREIGAAINCLLAISGKHFKKNKALPIGHDPSITGWPWIENTHSWVVPTSLAVIALKACRYGDNNRVKTAVDMILNRQLPSGGWNYGNTTVFGTELKPSIECTGHALAALAGFDKIGSVSHSIEYLKREIQYVRTPLSLSWALIGLSEWSIMIPSADEWIIECLSLQKKYGDYDTTLIAQLVIVYITRGRLMTFLLNYGLNG